MSASQFSKFEIGIHMLYNWSFNNTIVTYTNESNPLGTLL